MPRQPASRLRVGVGELPPRGDDARRVAADLVHVGELHRVGLALQLVAQPADLVGLDHDERGLAGRQPFPNERCGTYDKLMTTVVHHCFVLEAHLIPLSPTRG